MRATALINNFAIRCFRDIADGDYITARMAYHGRLYPQFLWSAQQTVEKYLKCILLLNRIKASDVRHNLELGIKKINQSGLFTLSLAPETIQFISYLNAYGCNRYFEKSYYSLGLEIVSFDRAVWEIRRYCTVLNYELELANGDRKAMLAIELKRISKARDGAPQTFKLMGGLLEKILASQNHPSRGPLIRGNLFYGKRHRKVVRIRRLSESANAPLFLHPEILDEISQYILIPKEIRNLYRR
jgi:HEPN domain-containing protein